MKQTLGAKGWRRSKVEGDEVQGDSLPLTLSLLSLSLPHTFSPSFPPETRAPRTEFRQPPLGGCGGVGVGCFPLGVDWVLLGIDLEPYLSDFKASKPIDFHEFLIPISGKISQNLSKWIFDFRLSK